MTFTQNRFRSVILFPLIFWSGLLSATIPYVASFDPVEGALFRFQDDIAFPVYAWPHTLLDCPVDFSAAGITADELELIDQQSDKAVPFQLTNLETRDGRLLRATVQFFSDLPSGAERVFQLRRRQGRELSDSGGSPGVQVQEAEGRIRLVSDVLSVSVPTGLEVTASGVVGPVAELARGGRELGGSWIREGGLKVTEVETSVLDSGPLSARCEIRFRFDNGGRYTARIHVIAGYEHFEFEEEIEGLMPEHAVRMEMVWSGLDPKHRFAAGSGGQTYFSAGRLIDKPFQTLGTLEDPHWSPAWRENPAEEMVMRLLPFQGNHVRESAPCVSFWEEGKNMDALEAGLFVLDHEKWQDHQYKTWQHSTTLQVTFRHSDGILYWMWPLAPGTRSTGWSVTEPAAGQSEVKDLWELCARQGLQSEKWIMPRYVQLLHQWYAALSLNRVKHWVLRYPDSASQPDFLLEPDKAVPSPEEYERQLFRSLMVQYPLGINFEPGGYSIYHRFVYKQLVPEYLALRNLFGPERKRRIDALLLFAAYVTSGEEMHPIRTAVAGCPNMAADGWAVPAQMAFLFPGHPMSGEWLDYYERTWEITHRKYTRPDVAGHESLGGRWTESLGTYNWAHLRPTAASLVAGILTDGKNRWTSPETVLRGRWMVDMLTAPVYNPDPYWRQNWRGGSPTPPAPLDSGWMPGDPFDPALGFTRQYPAQGGHSSGTGMAVPQIVESYGHLIRHVDPLVSEHLLWAAGQGNARKNVPFESPGTDPWLEQLRQRFPDNSGTNPHLKSVKYTGHGVVLRSGVDTPDELSIHLNQVDRGPNYRWGVNGENSSGSLYYFAGGRLWTGHERESSGDRALDATDGLTTFGVLKDGSYRSIGMNVLEKPLYDLGVAQFTEITSRKGESAYAWPEYQSRSIMLVGSDYWLLSDHIHTDWRFRARFTWFTAQDADFPKLIFLNPERIRPDHWTELQTPMSKGFHRDFHGNGDFLHTVLVTHREEIEPVHMRPNALPFLRSVPVREYRRIRGYDTPQEGAWRIQSGNSLDIVFRSLEPVDYENEEGDHFEGRAGVIRHLDDGMVEMAMCHSRKMAAAGLTVAVDREEIGVGCRMENGRIEGVIVVPEAGVLTLEAVDLDEKTLYVNSRPVEVERDNGTIRLALPSGRHTWQLLAGPPRPARPVIQSTEYLREGVRVTFGEAAGALDYRIEISSDGGNEWEPVLETDQTTVLLPELEAGKHHVRVTARNGDLTGSPAHEWPIYVTEKPPHHPEGLALRITENGADVSWGRVLGVTEYRLYRRETGTDVYEQIHSGRDRSFTDVPPKPLTQPYPLPGMARNAHRARVPTYEYAVSAVNGFGEGRKSHPVSTDPSGWLVWQPSGPLGFSRRSAFWEPPYVPAYRMPPNEYCTDEGVSQP